MYILIVIVVVAIVIIVIAIVVVIAAVLARSSSPSLLPSPESEVFYRGVFYIKSGVLYVKHLGLI